MMKTTKQFKVWTVCFVAVIAFLWGGSISSIRAAGLLVADGGFGGALEIKDHDVAVTVNNGIAVTRVTQVFHNTERRQVEALYTFPVPKKASVANFSMWINGKEVVGEVLEKERARKIYESYKQTRRDPGLLEQTDYRTFEMRIFPIGPQADQKVQITYYQELDFDQDWATYVYPLATATRPIENSRTTGRFAMSVDAKSAIPIVKMESPSHGEAFALANHNEHYWQANLEANGGNLAEDVVVAFRIARAKTGIDLITSRAKGADGFFCLTLATGQEVAARDDGMDYVFVLDVSGSMADGGKLLFSKDAIAAFLKSLDKNDRFELMVFNNRPDLAFGELRSADETQRQAAVDYLSGQQARGGTVLQPAMATAYKYAAPDRPLNVIILSDGLTEQQERQVLLQQIESRPGNTRVFCIGVGNDVNRPLLEQLADDSGGLAAFISSGDNFERQARAFRQKLTRPFATNLQLSIDGVDVIEMEPAVLPNLYAGSPIRVYGRYRGSGMAQVKLRGSVQGMELKEVAELEFLETDPDNPEIDRLWAWHRVHRLLKDADRKGSRDGVIDEIVRLGEDFSIVTEYTSFLVLENDAEYQRWKIARRNLATSNRDRLAQNERREMLNSIRDRALADLGPQAPVKASSGTPASQPNQPDVVAPASSGSSPQATPVNRSNARSWDFNTGSGPVGPIGLLACWWLNRRRRRQSA